MSLVLRAALFVFATSCLAADSVGGSQSTKIAAVPATGFLRPTARAATLTERLLSDARDRRLDDSTFLSAVLIASGAETTDDLKKWIAMYVPVRSGIRTKLPAGTTSDRMKAIHAAAHQFILTGTYQESCSDLRTTFATGDFNCLTSLAVCFDLCELAGLHVQPLLVRGHVSLAYQRSSGQMQVFEPGAAEWLARPVNVLAGSRMLTPVELFGKFYYNRGVEQLRAGRYEGGLILLRTSLALDAADDEARANLVAGLNNWAVEQFRAGRYDQAAALVEQGRALDPNFAPLIANEQLVRTKVGK